MQLVDSYADSADHGVDKKICDGMHAFLFFVSSSSACLRII